MSLDKMMLTLAIGLSVTGKHDNKRARLSASKEDGNRPLRGTPPNPARRTKAQKKADKRARHLLNRLNGADTGSA